MMKYSPDYSSRFRILKGGKISLVVSALIASVTMLQASPSGGVVTAGSASIAQNGSVTNITQTTGKAAINWQNFSIGTAETVNFIQPSVNAVTLNRVVGNEKSIIDGALNANGQVFILNSNGLLFSKNASINTAGLVATTMNLSDTDFMNGNYNFKGESTASIINQGTINISDKGYAALFGKEVKNEGIIKATLGKVELVGAKEVTLNLNGNSLVSLKVGKGVLDALVENKGAIYADGGEVYLTTNAVNELLNGVVNNTGMIQAQSFEDVTGKIELFAHGGTINVSGTLNAEGGFIETSGNTLHVSDKTTIKAKEWLIDPVDITIESTGSTTDLAASSIKASFIETTLNGGTGVTLSATHDITVNEALSWNQSLFTLTAANDIYVNAVMSATGTAALTMNTSATAGKGVKMGFNPDGTFKGRIDYSASGALTINGNAYTRVNDVTELDAMTFFGKYYLGANIDASATSLLNSGAGFSPSQNTFTGNFNGLGHIIDGLFINRPTEDYIGLFGGITGASISNIGLVNASIIGRDRVGGLSGTSNVASIINSYVTGSVHGRDDVGGLVGYTSNQSTITNSYTTSSVTGTGNTIGGLVGHNIQSTITNSYTTGNVTTTGDVVGGLVGGNHTGTITNSYAIGSVTGDGEVGGLVGNDFQGTITDSHAIGSVTGTGNYIGGLVGFNMQGTITNSYATGSVMGVSFVGGLVGYNLFGTIIDSYTTGSVTGTGDTIGGLVGENDSGTITNSFYNIDTAPINTVAGVVTYGGIYGAQFNDWLTHGKVLSASTYLGVADGSGFYTIATAQNLKDMLAFVYDVNGKFKLTSDLVLASGWNIPILYGAMDGNGHTLSGLNVQQSYNDTIGFIGTLASGATLSNIGLLGVNISGKNNVGGLVGNNYGAITNSYTTGNVTGMGGTVGGLVGNNKSSGTITNSHSSGSVNGVQSSVGGLAGYNDGSITNSYATGSVNGRYDVGGLVGSNAGSIIQSYATGSVTGLKERIGGLVGANGGNITNSYATGSASGTYDIGGLVGNNYGSIAQSYATGSATGTGIDPGWGFIVGFAGGLVGENSGSITDSYATGNADGIFAVGGLVGYNGYIITNSYATGIVTGTGNVAGLVGFNDSGTVTASFYNSTKNSTLTPDADNVGKTTVELKTLSTFIGLDIVEDSALAIGTPVLSMNGGSPIWKIGTSTVIPSPPPTPTPDISHIENGTAIIPPRLNIDTPRLVTANPPSYTNAQGQRIQLMSTPLLDMPTVMVSTQQVRVIQEVESGDLRVPMMQGSLIYLLNGGLNLPNGVEQEFFMLANR